MSLDQSPHAGTKGSLRAAEPGASDLLAEAMLGDHPLPYSRARENRQSTPNAHATASTCTFACAAKEAIAVSARTRTNGDRQIDPRLRAERLARARAHSCRLFRSAAAMIVAADITAARMRAWGLAPTCWRVLKGDWQEPGRWQIETAP